MFHKYYSELQTSGVINREIAEEINSATDGELFVQCHKNSFTERLSDVNLDVVVSLLLFKCQTEDDLSNDTAIDLMKRFVELKQDYNYILNKQSHLENLEYVTSVHVIIGDVVMPVLDVNISDLHLLQPQFIAMFTNNCEVQLNKLVASQDISPVECTLKTLLEDIKVLRAGMFDTVHGALIKSITTTTKIDKDVLGFMNTYENNTMKLGLEFMATLLNIVEVREKEITDVKELYTGRIIANRNKL